MSYFTEADAVERLPDFARQTVNLADARMGAAICAVSDEFFAEAPRMLAAARPRFYPDLYDDHGKWMDGWETRRRRGPGYDWCVVRLGLPGVIHGVDLDTSFFTGNYAPAASLEACRVDGDPDDSTNWQTLVSPTSLGPDRHTFRAVADDRVWTHVRVNILPDGGIARLRVYGSARPDWSGLTTEDGLLDVAALSSGGRLVAVSDAHFGDPQNLIAPGRGVNMGDGWETRRRREPGNDWCIIELARAASIERVRVDTAHFKGNFPDRCSIQAAHVDAATDESLVTQSMFWQTLLAEQPLTADSIHEFNDVQALGPVTHVRFNIIPDGGVSRLRLLGRP